LFAPINRIPSDVLSLIPTHRSSEKDLISAVFVCRHWYRTLTQCGTLWSRLNLTIKVNDRYIKTLLERAKGCPLDITSARLHRVGTLALLSPHAQQLRNLHFVYNYWSELQQISEAVSGPLPLLRTLKINAVEFDPLISGASDPPSLPLFSGAVNLKKFCLAAEGLPFLNYFAFPNLTTFEISAMPGEVKFPASQLLDFFESSPTLRTVHIGIYAEILLADVPPTRVVVLPNVEVFTVVTEEEPDYRIATHISCPSARRASFICEQGVEDTEPQEAFPTSVSWDMIVAQYMKGSINEVVLEITTASNLASSCSLSFLSPDSTTLELGYRMITDDDFETDIPLEEKHVEVFSHASKAIRNHSRLGDVKRFRIKDRPVSLTTLQILGVAKEAERLFMAMGPLDELILDVSDLRPYFNSLRHSPGPGGTGPLNAYPLVKELTIIGQPQTLLGGQGMAGIVKVAKLRHALGVPFERVVFRMRDPPVTVVEELGPWVGAVDCYDEIIGDDQDLI